MASSCAIFLEILLAILLPPLGCEFLICVVLTLLGYVPGIIYAIYAIVVRSSPHDDEDYLQPINP
ncbi:Stress responsive protein [Handroanthus impetiginosus]|uniref:Stress responsive protein n=1 Tax=Handroanthus impetiginosus TaxID=429701 RepID=A0A2G9HJF1_9LAMI|nr:Stress responsive protein [Handroanthus impetiginosus]